MRQPNHEAPEPWSTNGSLSVGCRRLELAVKEELDAETARFSEFSPAPVHMLARHWPAAPKLGDITKIDSTAIEPAEVICGEFPLKTCQLVDKALAHNSRRRRGTSKLRLQKSLLAAACPGMFLSLSTVGPSRSWSYSISIRWSLPL
ncbi:hypothetical protein [Microbacterium azadirachtae]|uniref:hypothetical protein n=1 Tax=Microbacterium azadirachtae TaxID=582680 RepID=UPI000696797A|nr:hypothetical protein [Microbacterium azadirachtae]